MKEIHWRDEKLYRIRAQNYGDLIHRSFGVIVNSLAKGTAFAGIAVGIFFSPGMLNDLGKNWTTVFLPLVLVCAIGSGINDWWLYIREVEIRPDQLVGYSRGKSAVVGIREVREINEGRYWTLFGRAQGLMVRGKKTSIFVPAASPEYPEIKSRLSAWRPTATV
jgi:hypothetical protein